jgi:hypothetical protein
MRTGSSEADAVSGLPSGRAGKKAVRLALSLLLLSFLCPLAAEPADSSAPVPVVAAPAVQAVQAPVDTGRIEITAPDRVHPGDPVRVYLRSAYPITEGTICLKTPNGTALQSARIFALPADPDHSGRYESAALLGVPVTKLPGECELELSWVAPDSHRSLLRRIYVTAKKFPFEKIPLSAELSTLRAVPTQRKETETRTLDELISVFDANAVYASGPFSLPVAGKRRTAGFGDRRLFAYSDGTSERSVHYGIDFGEPTGTPVLAPASGLVVLAADREETGNTVVIEHLPGVFSILMHMTSLAVAQGDVVLAGTVVGHVGSTGVSTGPHLHWGVFVSGVAVNPDDLLSSPLLDTPALPGAQSSNGTP